MDAGLLLDIAGGAAAVAIAVVVTIPLIAAVGYRNSDRRPDR
jgi:hypothetical protein